MNTNVADHELRRRALQLFSLCHSFDIQLSYLVIRYHCPSGVVTIGSKTVRMD
jgi:hypothetical protein